VGLPGDELDAVRGAAWILAALALASLALASATVLGRVVGVNVTTAGFLYLTVVLAASTWGGRAVGTVTSIAATLCFNYFFFPPTGTLYIHDRAHWVALFSFLGASTLVSLAVERQRLLAEAAHLDAVRESDALKTALLRAVSHDLRTPLTAMGLEIEGLARALARQPEARDGLRRLALEQERLTRRIDNLLSLARLEAGLARPHPEAVPPALLFRAARESLSLLLAGRKVEPHVAPDCPDLWVDPSLALEIVVNLLENAARATAPGSPIELAALRGPGAPGWVRVEVRDRGPGAPAEIRRRLQGPRDPRPAGDGAPGGLGLQIARSFAEAHGGTLALDDRPDGGAVARVELPGAPDPPAGELEEAPA
jgi:K+-sensing histidine kinase KdpD